MGGHELLGLTVTGWLDALADANPVPGAGSAAALTAAGAAALVAMAASSSPDWQEAGGTAAQASRLRTRLAELAEEDAAVYAESIAALADRSELPNERRDFALGTALDRAARAPLAIALAASDTAWLARSAADHVRLEVQPDVEAAAMLAAAASAAAARLVEINLTAVADDQRVVEARRAADSAAAAVQSGR